MPQDVEDRYRSRAVPGHDPSLTSMDAVHMYIGLHRLGLGVHDALGAEDWDRPKQRGIKVVAGFLKLL